MARRTTVICDVCGKEWVQNHQRVGSIRLDMRVDISETAMRPGQYKSEVCSTECAVTWLKRQSREAGAARTPQGW